MKMPRHIDRRSGGFTLAEILAAMLIMAITVPVIVEAALLANRVGIVAERERAAAQLGDSKLNEIVATEAWLDGDASGTATVDGGAYTWRSFSGAWDDDTMRVVTVEVRFNVQGRDYTVRVVTLVPETSSDTEQDAAEGDA